MTRILLASASVLLLARAAFAHETHAINQEGAIASPADSTKAAAFDILAAHVNSDGRLVTFHMTTSGIAGAEQPGRTVSLGGEPVFAYVWPTSLDPAVIGFEGGTGILALAATSHPDFDDTPSSTRTTMVTRPMTGSSGTATGLS